MSAFADYRCRGSRLFLCRSATFPTDSVTRFAYCICFQPGPWSSPIEESDLVWMCVFVLEVLEHLVPTQASIAREVQGLLESDQLAKRCIEFLTDEEFFSCPDFFDPASSLAISMRTNADIWNHLIQRKVHLHVTRRIWQDFQSGDDDTQLPKRVTQLER